GITAELREVAPGRPNVVAHIGATASKEKAGLLIVAHIDTVGAGDMANPFTPREENGRLYGRGALDIKSGVAAMCAAAAAIVREGVTLSRPCIIAAVVDEECNSLGTQALCKEVSAQAAVVLEPTNLKLCIAHKGYAWFEVTTHGVAAHGSLPEVGRDAIRYMGRVVVALEALDRRLSTLPPHPLLGRGSLHTSLISGGHEVSSYPVECRMEYERRTLPGESDVQVQSEIDELLRGLKARDADFRGEARLISSRQAYQISPDAPIADAAANAIRDALGHSESCGMGFWTDTALLHAAGIPGVVFGPVGEGLHGAAEYVELDSVAKCTEVLRRLILSQCA
ncbi:MAG: M20/M25/M40 family metallo-hydrolase, partial [Acidobacteria bacterium]|nr:M20/M25/M40 family metallo-hydrolase [Acidobacteriota bacterium]